MRYPRFICLFFRRSSLRVVYLSVVAVPRPAGAMSGARALPPASWAGVYFCVALLCEVVYYVVWFSMVRTI